MEKKTMSRDEGYPRSRRTPSFSSTLLDAIYRSIDESKSNLDEDPQLGHFNEETTPKQSNSKQSISISPEKSGNKERMNLRRAVMIEDWMEKQSTQSSLFTSSIASSSSESTSGAAFSETEPTTKQSRLKSEKKQQQQQQQQKQQKLKREGGGGGGGGFARTKLRAMKMYGELNQKVKQPISPASRIASFLSSIFNAGNVKKAKMCYAGAAEDVGNFNNHKSKSPCFSSSASSFSRRSCMSKTPTCSSSSSSAKGKRSVRFYPVSVILGENSQLAHQNDPSLLPVSSVRKMTRVSSMKEVKKNSAKVKENGFMMKGYQNSCKNNQFDFRGSYENGGDNDEDDDDDDDDDDALSCSSSDLFELDHIVGAGRYQEELPVYETTNLERNKAIANGLLL